jgi:hypothetical protein
MGHRHGHQMPRAHRVQERLQQGTAHAGKGAVTLTLNRPNTQRNKDCAMYSMA